MLIATLLAACCTALPADTPMGDDAAATRAAPTTIPVLARRMPPVVPPSAPSLGEAEAALSAALRGDRPLVAALPTDDPDGAQGKRRKAVEVSEWYGRRLTLHRWAAYATVPAFAYQYYLGQKLYDGTASNGQRDAHRANAYILAGLFGTNTVTGLWNLWDSRAQVEGRGTRIAHTLAMLAADAIFVYAGTLPDDDGFLSRDDKSTHRSLALTGMGITLLSGTYMRFFR